MTRKFLVVLCLGMLAFLPCLIAPGQAQTKISDDQVKQIATDEMTSIMKSIESQNYEQYSRDFSDKMKSAEKPDAFIMLCKKIDSALGKMSSLNFIGFYVQGNDTMALFKAKFSKTSDDVLIRLVLDLNSPKQRVVGLWFDSPKLGK